MGLSPGTGEQAIMADTVEPVRKHMDEKAADELGGRKAQDGSFAAGFDAIILPLERDSVGISTDQAAV